ncbi:hypothetical protein Tco_1066069, partial [Tanacetum coccineum]
MLVETTPNKQGNLEYVQRITAEATLNHEWCREVPHPKSKDFIPTFGAHELIMHRRNVRLSKEEEKDFQ